MRNALYLVLFASTVVACGGSEGTTGTPGSGGATTGGSTGQGGENAGGTAAMGMGGSAAVGAASGGFQATGATAGAMTGGAPVTGGGGTAAGGATGAGGSAAGGGTNTGGTDPAGGTQPAGGSPAGGSPAGGSPAGGSPAGGSDATGGTDPAGGAEPTGGAEASGGAETGGAGTGGAETCAAPTGDPGTPITFNDNGGWCWYQDERAIVDAETNKLIVGSVASGGSRDGDVEAVVYDLAAGGNPQRSTLGTNLSVDDHNTAGIVKVSAGKYVAVYTGHNENCNSYYNVYDNGSWGQQKAFDWGTVGCPVQTAGGERTISYSNLWQMPGKIFNFVRSVATSPNLIVSTDGSSWSYAGRLTSTDLVGYVAGYYKYWGDNVDRIDFIATEAHPRDEDNSLYHGYVKATGSTVESFDSFDQKQGTIDQASKDNSPEIGEFTKIFATGTSVNGTPICRLWNHDVVRYADGTIVVLGQGRADNCSSTPDNSDPDKRLLYFRFDGTEWSTTYLVKAGPKLYDSEQDYTGLGAVHPNDPHTIYISTTYDPRDESKAPSQKREIWRGTTCDEGKTFDWTQITKDSSVDNIRPIVPSWPGGKTALLWMKGTYRKAQDYTMSIVGLIIDGP